MTSASKPFFWLHIRKAAGTSLLKALKPDYLTVNRLDPLPFVALPRPYWNDNLNNFRVRLGRYTFKRMVFAKTFLYEADSFDEMYKFAVVRNPYERAESCWKYLTAHGINLNPKSTMRALSFSYFLDSLPDFWESISDLHIATHTAPMWPDISCENDEKLLLDKIVYLERLDQDMAEVFSAVGLQAKPIGKLNATRKDPSRSLPSGIKSRIERLYSQDFEHLYPNV